MITMTISEGVRVHFSSELSFWEFQEELSQLAYEARMMEQDDSIYDGLRAYHSQLEDKILLTRKAGLPLGELWDVYSDVHKELYGSRPLYPFA